MVVSLASFEHVTLAHAMTGKYGAVGWRSANAPESILNALARFHPFLTGVLPIQHRRHIDKQSDVPETDFCYKNCIK